MIVVGGGTSGMMAAISAASHGADVLLVEKNNRLGKKLLLTGGGRCNVTNNRPAEEIIRYIPGNGKFLFSAFSQFDNFDIIRFFEERRTPLKEEDHGRMFPVSNRSKTIVDTLQRELDTLNVQLLTDSPVKKLLKNEHEVFGIRLENGKEFLAPCTIIATGGKSYPHTGSTGIGYKLAKSVGHKITPLFATESPIKLRDAFIKNKQLQGLSLQNVSLSVLNSANKPVVSHQMDVLFTHFGISGPAALRCSMFVNRELEKRKQVELALDAMPQKSLGEIEALLRDKKETAGNKSIKNALKGLLPDRYLTFLLQQANIELTEPFKQIQQNQLEDFARLVKSFKMTAVGTYPIEKSFVTGGGVHLKEIDPRTLKSKLIDGLFFAGEVLDINGYTGGYNITAAFVTGYVAGKHSAESADLKE